MLRILHLEDDTVDSELVRQLLVEEGLPAEIQRVDTLADFRSALAQATHALILSDYRVPGIDPMEVLQLARRERPEVPFLFVSGVLGEELAVETLKLGASDYVLKQGMRRLAPAVRRALQEADEQTRRRAVEAELKALNQTLEQRVLERTAIAEQRADQLRLLAGELILAEERQRRRLAKILHDHLQQLLVAARLKVGRLRRRSEGTEMANVAAEVDHLLEESIRESRSLTVELSPPVLYDRGLAGGLEWLARQTEDKHDLPVEIDIAPDTEPAEESVRIFLFQAARELLLNVVKHAQADTAWVELNRVGEDRLRLAVFDTGGGFDPLRLTSQGHASGFGLFSVRERAELFGGRFEMQSTPGEGTRVVIEVPRGSVAAAATGEAVRAAEVAAADLRGMAAEGPADGQQRKIRVLLADDHAVVRQGLAGLLREFTDFEVVGQAADGFEAVELAAELKPDVVLMDITMPGINGIEATRRILGILPRTRVIGLSMHEEADMAIAIRKAGAVGYLRKDADTDDLVAAIRCRGSET